jgi:predicted TPR repeat methyltransferase
MAQDNPRQRDTLKTELALEALFRLAELTPADADAWRNLVAFARRVGDREAEAAAFAGWSSHHPDDPTARHFHAVFSGADLPRADEAYVAELYDAYAAHYETRLAALQYRAPQIVADRVAALRGDGPALAEAVDLGCGTGLLGRLVRPVAQRLTGVDLSTAMLSRAAHCGCYDQLVHSELTAFLRDHSGSFDLVVSADTLNYVGDLRPVVTAALSALRWNGWMVVTLEHCADDPPAGYRLEESGRYSHNGGWVARALHSAGFVDVTLDPCVLRQEDNADVSGLLVAARRAVSH